MITREIDFFYGQQGIIFPSSYPYCIYFPAQAGATSTGLPFFMITREIDFFMANKESFSLLHILTAFIFLLLSDHPCKFAKFQGPTVIFTVSSCGYFQTLDHFQARYLGIVMNQLPVVSHFLFCKVCSMFL
jgi:hypothetical protein